MLTEEFENALSDLLGSMSDLVEYSSKPTLKTKPVIRIEAAYIEYNSLIIKLSNIFQMKK